MTISLLAIDLAKHVFQLHGVNRSGAMVLRKRLRRAQMLAFIQSLPRCTIAVEACSSAHFWGRVSPRGSVPMRCPLRACSEVEFTIYAVLRHGPRDDLGRLVQGKGPTV